MNEKIDWMMGMSENMLNITNQNMDKPMMDEISQMTSTIKGNLDQMKMRELNYQLVDVMEQMMRNMEQVMIKMNAEDENQKMIMKLMLNYIIIMQSSM